MKEKKQARCRCSSTRAKVSRENEDAVIVSPAWTRAQCRAMELALGGGFIALAVLEAMFGW